MSRVTVFMPVYNKEKYLKDAINSILNQTYKDFELLIIEDGSTDNSRSILQKFTDTRIKIHCNTSNMGIAYTRNKGLELCKTEYIAIMDADDVAMLNRLELQIDYLDNNRDLIGVGGYAQIIDENGNIVRGSGFSPIWLNPDYIKANMILENTLANGSVMLRTGVYKKHNITYSDYSYGEDYKFFCELLQYGKIANINEIIYQYRIVSNGLANSSDKNKRDAVIDCIHEFNFELYGFKFTKQEKNILLKAFRENGRTTSLKELEVLFGALQSMASQAEMMNLDVSKEIKIMCRKQFGKQVSKAFFLWE